MRYNKPEFRERVQGVGGHRGGNVAGVEPGPVARIINNNNNKANRRSCRLALSALWMKNFACSEELYYLE